MRLRLVVFLIAYSLQAPLFSAAFSSEAQRQGFLRALEAQDRRYDPAACMIRRPFSSPGYHTTLTGGTVHPTRDSLQYALALLDSGEPARLERAAAVLEKVISLQDQDPASRTYGIWSWFLEEPLETMAPPDWNWADFCGALLLQVARDHGDRLSEKLRAEVRASCLHAAHSIKRSESSWSIRTPTCARAAWSGTGTTPRLSNRHGRSRARLSRSRSRLILSRVRIFCAP